MFVHEPRARPWMHPPRTPRYRGPLAQLAEQQTLNLRVEGSIPSRLTTFINTSLASTPHRFEMGTKRPSERQSPWRLLDVRQADGFDQLRNPDEPCPHVRRQPARSASAVSFNVSTIRAIAAGNTRCGIEAAMRRLHLSISENRDLLAFLQSLDGIVTDGSRSVLTRHAPDRPGGLEGEGRLHQRRK